MNLNSLESFSTVEKNSENVQKENSTGVREVILTVNSAPLIVNIQSSLCSPSSHINQQRLSCSGPLCRICHEGTLGLAHASCIEKWLSSSNTTSCEICKFQYNLSRRPKSIFQWLQTRSPLNGPSGFCGDVFCLVLLTPLCIGSVYLCAIGARAYIKHGLWEGTGLAMLCCFLMAVYILWCFVAVRSLCPGSCSSADQQNGSQVFEENGDENVWAETQRELEFGFAATPPEGRLPMQNSGYVKFEVPKVPVIFVLGGPGSGKVTHGDSLMQEKRGITHINMTDLLQQYAIGNEMKDFSQLSSKTVTEVLMLEMKMAPAAKTYLVSGYPRSMRDVAEYAEKIQMVNGVILVAWQQKVLERQIDYGAKIGHVVLSLAKMELNNFYKNVMPVAEYFDQRGMLISINGERNPAEVYKDFRSAVLRILGSADQTSSSLVEHKTETLNALPNNEQNSGYKIANKDYPPVIWVIGGPGSNKASLCQKVVRQAVGWAHFSVGRLLRAASEATDPKANDSFLVRQAISSGEMVPQGYVLELVESEVNANLSAEGILIDGFPRDMNQVHEFENKFKQQPNAILLDCSKLQLGRGRLDDSVAAFRRRLELFRELSLPMLKILDNENRLTIVDGDTDTTNVQEEFGTVVLAQMERLKKNGGMIVPESQQNLIHAHYEAQIHDLEDPIPAAQPVLSNGVPPSMNGAPRNMVPNGITRTIQNGLIGGVQNLRNLDRKLPNARPSRDTIRDMYADVESYR